MAIEDLSVGNLAGDEATIARADERSSVDLVDEAVKRVITRTVDDLPMFSSKRLKTTTSLSTVDEEAFIYWRYSTDRQEDTSAERQIAACEAYLGKAYPSTTTVFGDRGLSGVGMEHRGGLMTLRAEALRLRPRRIVVEDLDRLSRRLSDLLVLHTEFSALGIEIHDVVHGRLDLIHIMIRGYMGEEGRVRFLSLGKTGRRQAVSNGRMMQKVAYGFRHHPERACVHIKDETTAPVVQEIFGLVASGMSMRAVARLLTNRGTPPPAQACIERKGGKVAKVKPWQAATIRDIVRSYIYIGYVLWAMTEAVRDPATNKVVGRAASTHGGQVVIEMPELALVDRDVWTRANMRITDGIARPNSGGDPFLFTRKALCALCREPMTGLTVQGHSRYTCSTRIMRGLAACPAERSVRVDHLERSVFSAIFCDAVDADGLAIYTTRLRRALPALLKDDRKRRADILRQIEVINDLMMRSHADERENIVSKALGRAQRRALGVDADRLESQLAALRHESQYLVGLDGLDILRQNVHRVIDEVPFRPKDPEGVALAQTLRDVVSSLVVHQPDANGDTLVVINVDPFLAVSAEAKIEGLDSTLRLEARFNAKALSSSANRARWDAIFAKVDDAARDRRFAIDDEGWAVAAPFFADVDFIHDGKRAPRVLMDGMLCVGAMDAPYSGHIPKLFGDAGVFRSAVARFIYSGRFDDAVEALTEAGVESVKHLAFFEATRFARREEKMPMPDAEHAIQDRAELLAIAACLPEGSRARLNCELVAAVLDGERTAPAARRLGLTERSAYYQWYRYIRGGVERIAPVVEMPSKQRLSQMQLAKLKAVVEQGVDPAAPDRPVTVKAIRALVSSWFKVEYSVGGLRGLLHRNSFDIPRYVAQARREGRLKPRRAA